MGGGQGSSDTVWALIQRELHVGSPVNVISATFAPSVT